jgi:hypothetical protein
MEIDSYGDPLDMHLATSCTCLKHKQIDVAMKQKCDKDAAAEALNKDVHRDNVIQLNSIKNKQLGAKLLAALGGQK